MAKAGQPTRYKAEYNELAFKYCLLGATDERLAEFFDVTIATITNWKNVHPEFFASIKKGKDEADAQIAHALFHRAKGYSHPEVDIKMYEGQIIQTDLVKHYPPDTGAAMAWLKNRQPRQWRDKQDVDLRTPDGIQVQTAEVSNDELRESLKRIGLGRTAGQLDQKIADK